MDEAAIDRQQAAQIVFALEPMWPLSELQARWHELENRADASFFQSWDWISCWIEEAQIAPRVLVGRSAKAIVALGLLQPFRPRHLSLKRTDALLLHHLGEKEKDALTIVYNGLLIDRDVSLQTVQNAIDFLFIRKSDAAFHKSNNSLDELYLRGVPQQYEQYAHAPGTRQVVLSRQRSWKVDLDKIRASNRGYLEYLSANTRYQIRRALRLYKGRGEMVAKRAGNVDEALAYYDALKEVSKEYWARRGRTSSFAYPFFERFHRRLIHDCVPRGTVELMRVTAGSQLIGYLYNFIHKGWIYAYQCAFVFEDDPKYKPGLVAHALCIEQHLREGARIYDFLAGYGRYKTNLGIPGLDMLDIVLQRPKVSLTVENFLRRAKRKLGSAIA